MTRALTLCTAGLLALLLGMTWSAAAQSTALAESPPVMDKASDYAGTRGEVLVILGSTEGEGIDPALEKIEALRHPTFAGFTKKQLLETKKLDLSKGSDEVALPNGRRLKLSLSGRAPDGRYHVSVSIKKPGKKAYLPVMKVAAAAGDLFFVGGQKHKGGTLILGLRVLKK